MEGKNKPEEEIETDNEEMDSNPGSGPGDMYGDLANPMLDEPMGTEERNHQEDLNETMLQLIAEADAREEQERIANRTVAPTIEHFVPRPEDGFPCVYGGNMTHMYENLHTDQLKSWMKQEGSKLCAMPFKDSAHNVKTNRKKADAIRQAVKELFNLTAVSVTPALPKNTPYGLNAAPYTFLISGIPSWVARKLEDRQCVANSDIQFLTFPIHWLGPTHKYVGSLQNLVTTNLENLSERGREALMNDLTRIFMENAALHAVLRNIVIERNTSHPEDQDMDLNYNEAIREFLDVNLAIRILDMKEPGQVPSTSVNMYINMGLQSDGHRVDIVNALKTMSFGTYDFGTGTYFAGWKCASCRGIDHPGGMCTFYNVPLWTEITKTTPMSKPLGHGNPPTSYSQHQATTSNHTGSNYTNQYSSENRGRGRGYGPQRRPQHPRGRGNTSSTSYRGGWQDQNEH